MDSNLMALFVGIAVLLFLIYAFYPDKGLIARWKKAVMDTKKVHMENALKHLYDCEYNKLACTLDSLAGNLSLNRNHTAEVIESLQKKNLLTGKGDVHKLTPEGRSYALRLIRIHRLWERYLADETSVLETEWHDRAEEIEHKMSVSEANALAARIGNPLVDPHGDPIPDATGVMPERTGKNITELNEGDFASLVHLEDEPSTIYAQLIAAGLYVGQQIQIIESSNERVKFEADGELCVFAPIIAANISVEPKHETENIIQTFQKLSELRVGQAATVIGIAKSIRGQQRRRLLDLGIVPGTKISSEIESIGNDPTGYRVRGATIALRKIHAHQIFINDIN